MQMQQHAHYMCPGQQLTVGVVTTAVVMPVRLATSVTCFLCKVKLAQDLFIEMVSVLTTAVSSCSGSVRQRLNLGKVHLDLVTI